VYPFDMPPWVKKQAVYTFLLYNEYGKDETLSS
jgi:hypothetical protein